MYNVSGIQIKKKYRVQTAACNKFESKNIYFFCYLHHYPFLTTVVVKNHSLANKELWAIIIFEIYTDTVIFPIAVN